MESSVPVSALRRFLRLRGKFVDFGFCDFERIDESAPIPAFGDPEGG